MLNDEQLQDILLKPFAKTAKGVEGQVRQVGVKRHDKDAGTFDHRIERPNRFRTVASVQDDARFQNGHRRDGQGGRRKHGILIATAIRLTGNRCDNGGGVQNHQDGNPSGPKPTMPSAGRASLTGIPETRVKNRCMAA
ncbi:MAG: hypothetical protein P4M00_02540 [Azospirillaceae bacterium]|nr:hypothetical protein [Azospirillaceae bacterium]